MRSTKLASLSVVFLSGAIALGCLSVDGEGKPTEDVGIAGAPGESAEGSGEAGAPSEGSESGAGAGAVREDTEPDVGEGAAGTSNDSGTETGAAGESAGTTETGGHQELTGNEPGFEVLGAGYDVLGNYADPVDVMAEVLDSTSMLRDGLVELRPYERATFFTAWGTTTQQYAQSLNHSTQLSGGYSFFSASVGVNFSETRTTDSSYSFATVQSLIKKTGLRVKLDVTAEQLRAYLTERASSNLNDASVAPETLFETYGTHVVKGLIVGGRLDYSVSADMSRVGEASEVGVYAEASFKSGYASADLNTSTTVQKNLTVFNETVDKRLEVYGGQSEYGQDIVNDNQYRAWIESVNDNPTFCDFEERGLLPIWELASDASRRAAIEAAFEAWAEDHELPAAVAEAQPCVVGIQVLVAGRPAAELTDGYKLLNINLNAGTDSDTADIWIYYKVGPDDGSEGQCITRLYTVDTTNGETNPAGGTTIAVDLNQGAGGDFIYLGYVNEAGAEPVRAVAVKDDASTAYSDGGSGYDYLWVTHQGSATMQDLNEDAGGDFVYVGYSYGSPE
jgi:hypothetical protein